MQILMPDSSHKQIVVNEKSIEFLKTIKSPISVVSGMFELNFE